MHVVELRVHLSLNIPEVVLEEVRALMRLVRSNLGKVSMLSVVRSLMVDMRNSLDAAFLEHFLALLDVLHKGYRKLMNMPLVEVVPGLSLAEHSYA